MVIGISIGTKSIVCFNYRTTPDGSVIGCISNPITVPAAISCIDGSIRCGQKALNCQEGHQHVLLNVKRLLGKQLNTIKSLSSVNVSCCRLVDTPDGIAMRVFDPKDITNATDISVTSCMTQILENAIEQVIGDTMPLSSVNAVVTYPLGPDQRIMKVIDKSMEEVKVGHYQLLPKSAAIAMAYSHWHPEEMEDQSYLVYSFGGGMFETSMVQFSRTNINLCYYDGNTALGGIDIDNVILKYVISELMRDTPSIALDVNGRYKLIAICEKAKEELSQRESTVIDLQDYVHGKTVTLSRKQFNQLIKPIVDETITMTQNLALKWKRIHPNMQPIGILLAGGSSEIPFVRERLIETIGLSIVSTIPVCNIAAEGCCEYGKETSYGLTNSKKTHSNSQ